MAAVRWLIGPQLGISANTPSVECIIMSGKLNKLSGLESDLSEYNWLVEREGTGSKEVGLVRTLISKLGKK